MEIQQLDTAQTTSPPMISIGTSRSVFPAQAIRTCARGRAFARVDFRSSSRYANLDGNVARLSSDQPTAIGQIVTKPIQPGIYYTQAIVAGTSYGLALDPIGNGTTSVSATGPAGVLTMTTTGTRNVTVSTPAIVPSAATLTVGSGLQLGAFAVLGASQHGGVTMTVTSSAPSVVRVSPDSVTPGATTIGVPIANGTTFVPFVIQGLEGTSGTATVTLSAQGFTSTTIAVTVTASAIEIINLPTNISAESPNVVSWYVQVGLPSGNGSGLIEVPERARRVTGIRGHADKQHGRGGPTRIG